MQVHVEEISPAQKKVTIEIPVEQVDAEIEKYYAAIQKNAKMQGFRPGKVPMHVIRQNFSESMPHVVKHRLYDKNLNKALEEHKIEPVDSPAIEGDILEQGAPFKFTALVEVMPDNGLEAQKETSVDYVFGWKDCLKRAPVPKTRK
jgi:trigger factor